MNKQLNKTIGKKLFRPNPARAHRVVKDSVIADCLYEFCFSDDEDEFVVVEYEGDSTHQFYNYLPYIGCSNRHKSVIADFADDLANHISITSRQALFS